MSLYTPIFSAVGLFVLNHLPVPDASNYQSPSPQPTASTHKDRKPSAYVVLGGGLTEARTFKENATTHTTSMEETIVLNKYSVIRLQTVLSNYQLMRLPIVLTGVESPWMQDWLLKRDLENVVTENASMNTCENARFTAKRLHLTDVYLITDAYHMTRARRQFALNGIHTVPIVAALPVEKSWLTPKDNFRHSRRTFYELAAYARDVYKPQTNCRAADEVTFDTLLRSRKSDGSS